MLNDIDIHLLALLQTNSQRSFAELAKEVGLSVSAVNERVKKLEAQGYIRAYVAQLAPEHVGFDVCAFIYVLLKDTDAASYSVNEDVFLQRIDTLEEVQECHHITGEFSYVLKVRVRSMAHLEKFLKQGLKPIPGIARTQTSIVLSSRKETLALALQGTINRKEP